MRRRDESGTSLLEMMIVCLVLAIIFPVIAGFLFSVQRSEVTVTSRASADGEAEAVAQTLSRQIHAAAVPSGMPAVIKSAAANSLVFYAAMGNTNGPTEVSLYVVPACSGCSYGNLMEDLTQPTLVNGQPTYAATPNESVEVGSGVVVPAVTPLTDCPGANAVAGIFQYFVSSVTGNGACLSLDTSTTPPSLDGSQLPKVENVVVTMSTIDASRPTNSPAATVSLDVYLANVDYANP